jgi:ubiquinone/menaquinone biosynthesis C-methylase UbiE
MTGYNVETSAYVQNRPLKHHEAQTLQWIERERPGFSGRLLDVGCADGRMLQAIAEKYPRASLSGFDYSEVLVEQGRRILPTGVNLQLGDAARFTTDERFDVILASGLISIFDDPLEILTRMSGWLAPKGLLIVFGRFTTADIDVRVHFRRSGQEAWQGGLTAFSLKTVGEHLRAAGFTYTWERFRLPISMARSDDPIRTYTVQTTEGESLVLNGANVLAEHYFLMINRP